MGRVPRPAARHVNAVIPLRPLVGLVAALFTLLMLAGASVAETHGREAELRPFGDRVAPALSREGCLRFGSIVEAAERADAEDDPELLATAFAAEIAPQFAPVLALGIRADPAPLRRRPCAAPPTGPPAA